MGDVTASPLALGPALMAWLAVGVRLPALWRDPGRLEQRALLGMLLSLSLGLTLSFPPVYLGLDRLVGVANLSRLLSDVLAMGCGLGLQVCLLLATGGRHSGVRQTRSRTWWLLGSGTLMTALFFVDPVTVETVHHMIRYGGPSFGWYRIIYLTFLCVALADVVRLCWRSARQARRPLVALGLRLYTLAAALGVLYVLHALGQLGVWWSGVANPLGRPELLSQALIGGVAVLLAAGSSIPLWARLAEGDALGRRLRTYRALQRLRPLWVVLADCAPEIALTPRRGRLVDRLDPRDLDFRLYRRVVEIRDGYLALRPHVDPADGGSADVRATEIGAATEGRRSTIEAAQLAAAVAAKKSGRYVAAPAILPDPGGGADLPTECAWLEQVAHAYVRVPVARTPAARGRRAPGRQSWPSRP